MQHIILFFSIAIIYFSIVDDFITRNRLIFDEQRGLIRECKTPQKSDAELRKYLVKKTAVNEEADTELSVEEIKLPSKKEISKIAPKKKPKPLVGRKRKQPIQSDANGPSSDSEVEVVFQQPLQRSKRFLGAAAALSDFSTDEYKSAAAITSTAEATSAAVTASAAATASTIAVADAARSASVTDDVCSVSVTARTVAHAVDAAAPFHGPITPVNDSVYHLPRHSTLQYAPMQYAPMQYAPMQGVSMQGVSMQGAMSAAMGHSSAFPPAVYPGVPSAMYIDSMSDLICDSMFYKLEAAQQKLQIDELKRREEERRASDYMKSVQSGSKEASRLHMRQMFGNHMM